MLAAKKKYIYQKSEAVKDAAERKFASQFLFKDVQSTDEIMVECYKERVLGDVLLGGVVLPISRYLMIGACFARCACCCFCAFSVLAAFGRRARRTENEFL